MKKKCRKVLNFNRWKYQITTQRFWFVYVCLTTFCTFLFILNACTTFSTKLKVQEISSFSRSNPEIRRPGQLPLSRVAEGNKNITAAWFANQTDRYQHGVLGDKLEATRLVTETSVGKYLHFDLPITRVFEDLEPRLVDLNGDDEDEIIVVESDTQSGASLAIYGIIEGRLERITATPFLGRPNRWLNPVGVGDFDGDSQLDIALVATPHIGGILRLYRIKDSNLLLFAEFSGVSTHKVGSTELGLGRVVMSSPRDLILVPGQKHRAIMLLEWTNKGLQEIARAELSGHLGSSLIPVEKDRWRFRLEDGKYFEIQVEQ